MQGGPSISRRSRITRFEERDGSKGHSVEVPCHFIVVKNLILVVVDTLQDERNRVELRNIEQLNILCVRTSSPMPDEGKASSPSSHDHPGAVRARRALSYALGLGQASSIKVMLILT